MYVMSLCVRRQTEVLIDQKRTKSVRQRETRPAEKAQQKQQREVWIVNTSRLKKTDVTVEYENIDSCFFKVMCHVCLG